MTQTYLGNDGLFALYAALETERLIPEREAVRAILTDAALHGGFTPASLGVPVVLTLPGTEAAHVGNNLAGFAEVARESGEAITRWSGHRSDVGPYGDPWAEATGASAWPAAVAARLEVRGVRLGSIHVLLEAVDLAATLLLSDPVQFVLTLHWFWEQLAPFHFVVGTSSRRSRSHEEFVAVARELSGLVRAAAGSDRSIRLEWQVHDDGTARGLLVVGSAGDTTGEPKGVGPPFPTG